MAVTVFLRVELFTVIFACHFLDAWHGFLCPVHLIPCICIVMVALKAFSQSLHCVKGYA